MGSSRHRAYDCWRLYILDYIDEQAPAQPAAPPPQHLVAKGKGLQPPAAYIFPPPQPPGPRLGKGRGGERTDMVEWALQGQAPRLGKGRGGARTDSPAIVAQAPQGGPRPSDLLVPAHWGLQAADGPRAAAPSADAPRR